MKIHQAQAKNFCRVLDIRVPQIVYANPFHPSLLTATVHFPVEIAFADGEHPAVRLHSIELLEVILEFITEELRHLDHAVTLGCFGGSDHILLIEPLVRLIDGDSALLKIKICRGQSQKFSLSNAAPVKHLKGGYLSPDEYEKQYKNKLLELEQKLAG